MIRLGLALLFCAGALLPVLTPTPAAAAEIFALPAPPPREVGTPPPVAPGSPPAGHW